MTVTSLNQIVNNILLKRRYPIHFYLDFLISAKDGLREICFDEDMKTLRYQIITLNSINIGELPNDFVDHARVFVRINQYLHPLVEDNSLDTIPNYDSDFTEQPYSSGVATETTAINTLYTGYAAPYWYMTNWNNFGENTGRQFGGVGTMADTFKIDTTRNIIKVNEYLSVLEIVLVYIGNGLDADSATHINAYAQNCIEAYCMWQFKENNRTYNNNDAEIARQQYITERGILRARLSDLTLDKMKRIAQGNAIAIKY